MPRTLLERLGATLAVMPLVAGIASAQGFTRTDVTNTPTHLVMNGLVPKTDTNEVDFLPIDIDLDGDVDVVIGRKTPFTSSVMSLPNVLLMNDGAGHLTDETATYTPFNTNADLTREVDYGDMNNDGWPDIVTFQTENQPTKIYFNLGNDAGGNWQGLSAPTLLQFGATFNFCGGAVVDFDLDGKLDVYRADYSSGANPSGHLDDLLRQGSTSTTYTNMTSAIPNLPTGQSFVGPQLSASDANFGTRVQTRDEAGNWLDINGDGFVDILVTGREKMRVAYTDGAGGFLATQELTPGSGSNGNDVYDSVCGDLDNDGRVDFYKVRDGTDIYTLNMSTLANGTIAQSADASPSATNGFGANARMVDFDGDGDLDVWVAPVDPDISNCGSNRLELFQNTGLTGANRLQLYTVGGANPWPRAVYDTGFADFDGDGIVDVIMAGCNPDPGYRYFVSDPNAMAITFSTEFIPQANGSKIFSVNNIPDAGGFRRLYNFFDLDASIPVGTGPFMGLTTSVLNQVSIGYPFTADLQPAQDVFQFTISAFAVQAIPVVRQRTALVDFLFGTVELTPVIEETSN